jgi:hypothetical protein
MVSISKKNIERYLGFHNYDGYYIWTGLITRFFLLRIVQYPNGMIFIRIEAWVADASTNWKWNIQNSMTAPTCIVSGFNSSIFFGKWL